MYRDFSPSEDQCKRGSKMFTYSRTCRVWHMLYGAEFSQLCFVGYSCRKILIRNSSPPPTQFHGQIILRKIKQSSPCDSRILRILIVLMCPDIFWEGQVAAFEPAPNLFLKGNRRASCAQYKEQKDLGIALHLWPRPKNTIRGPLLWFHCVMTFSYHEISPVKYWNVRTIDRKI